MKRYVCLILYYLLARHLPNSFTPFIGKFSKYIRYSLCKHIFKQIGTNVNIEKGASFGSGRDIVIGNNSGLGINCKIPPQIIIGNDVMMGPNCIVLYSNHRHESVNIPMRLQGSTKPLKVIIEDEDDINYKHLLRNEYNLCVPKFKKIIRNARVLYNQVVKYKMPIRKRCCDFEKLELKCIEYNNREEELK